MRIKSHTAMGRLLLQDYMPELPRPYAQAFLIGCVQPDRNPTTYVKGSLRGHWMRGHNYSNSVRFMARLAARLENRQGYRLWDFYSLGKLIHYTMDAFTYPHNEHFQRNLTAHRQYEIQLQRFFLPRVSSFRMLEIPCTASTADFIRRMHTEYMRLPGCMETDTAYALSTCCFLTKKLAGNVYKKEDFRFHSSTKDAILTGK